MKKDSELRQTDFDNLLDWLSPNRGEAGEKYEKLREGLMRFFRVRGCHAPEMLADETLNRIAFKLSSVKPDEKVKKISFALGFAANIYLEYLSHRRSRSEIPFDPELHAPEDSSHQQVDGEIDFQCLDMCLARLPKDERKLIVDYYQKDKGFKFEWRKNLAQAMNISIMALHTRVHRIKKTLRTCVEKCLKEK